MRNFAALEDCRLRTVCDLSPERLASVERNYPGVGITGRLEDLLDDDEIQGVAIATPVHSHFELARRALKAGKSVLVEKPLATSVGECEQLLETARKMGVALMVGHTFEYNAAVEHVERLIDEGELGDIHYIYSQRLNLGIVRQDVDAMWNLAPHDISIALRWLKQMPVTVNARGYTYLQEGISDVVFLNLEFADGVAVHVHVSWLDPGKIRRMTVVGSRKMVVYDDVSTDAKIQLYDKGIDRQNLGDSLGEFDSFGKFQLTQRAGDVLIPKLDFVEPLRLECAHFVGCISEGTTPLTDGENGLRVVRILEAATLSIERGGVAVSVGGLKSTEREG
jgi:predicted dehydrogenase